MKKFLKNKWTVLIIIFCTLFIFSIKFVNSKVPNNNIYKFNGLNMLKDDILIKLENKDLGLTLPIYVENNRYYLPVTEIVEKLKGKIYTENNNIHFNLGKNHVIVNTSGNKFTVNKKEYNLKKRVIVNDNIIYISMFDFTKMFDLKTYWDIENKTIHLYKNRDDLSLVKDDEVSNTALIRLEDITAGGIYKSIESLEKLRIVSDYLYKENIPFHVAWIPRYVKPSEGIDNDISKTYSMYNADFVFTLDYFVDRNGIIGLHGYTHQYRDSESVDGFEFHRTKNDNIPEDKEYAKKRVDMAIDVAKKLDIKYYFFEVPHYGILPKQLSAIEEKFDYIYEPYSKEGGITEYKFITKTNKNGKITLYIPTPLDYIDGKKDCNNMLKKMENLHKDSLGSFFYHPYIEFEDIKINRAEDGYPYYSYSEQSVLHKLTKKFKSKKYKFYKITDIK